MRKEIIDEKNQVPCTEIERELSVPPEIRDWKASIATQVAVGEFSKDPLIALELVN